MAKSVLNAAHFQNEEAALVYVEGKLWPNGPVCPHCQEAKRVGRLNGKTTRLGLHKCYACKKPFTVRMGTIFESSHLPLHLWLQVIHLFCASKKGISTRQIQRMLQCSMKTAWFLGHRIREVMTEKHGFFPKPRGGEGKVVEADEAYIGRDATKKLAGPGPQFPVMSLVEREGRGPVFPCSERDQCQPASDPHPSRQPQEPADVGRVAHLQGHWLELR